MGKFLPGSAFEQIFLSTTVSEDVIAIHCEGVLRHAVATLESIDYNSSQQEPPESSIGRY